MTDALKAQLEALFNKIVDFVMAILNAEFPEIADIIK